MTHFNFTTDLMPVAPPDAMSADEVRELFDALDLSNSAAARLLGVNLRTVRRWTSGELTIQPPAARFLRFLRAAKISPQEAMELLAEPRKRRR